MKHSAKLRSSERCGSFDLGAFTHKADTFNCTEHARSIAILNGVLEARYDRLLKSAFFVLRNEPFPDIQAFFCIDSRYQ